MMKTKLMISMIALAFATSFAVAGPASAGGKYHHDKPAKQKSNAGLGNGGEFPASDPGDGDLDPGNSPTHNGACPAAMKQLAKGVGLFKDGSQHFDAIEECGQRGE